MQFLMKLAVVVASTPALFSLVSAQTWSACNPMKRDGCPDNVALSGNFEYSFVGGAGLPKEFNKDNTQGEVLYQKDAAHFRIAKAKDSPTYTSKFYIMYGKVDVEMKASPGQGIVSSVVLQSDVLDEIDWEWLGGKTGEGQSNYFGKGNTETYDRGAFHHMNHQEFHTYGIEWTPEFVKWSIDGAVVRTLTPNQVTGGDFYPQTPMQVRLGSWAGGDPDNAKGTIEWAGGLTDFSKGPYDMVVRKMSIKDYSTGKYYKYSDRSGSAKSIVSEGGKINNGPSNAKNPELAQAPKDTATPDNKDQDKKPDSLNKDIKDKDTTSGQSSFIAPTNSGRIESTATTLSTSATPTSGNSANRTESTPAPSGSQPSGSAPSSGSPSTSVLSGPRQTTPPLTSENGAGSLSVCLSAAVGIAGLAAGLLL